MGQHSTALLNIICASSGPSNSTAAFQILTEFGICSKATRNTDKKQIDRGYSLWVNKITFVSRLTHSRCKGRFLSHINLFCCCVVVFVFFFKTNARDVSRKQLLVANTAKGIYLQMGSFPSLTFSVHSLHCFSLIFKSSSLDPQSDRLRKLTNCLSANGFGCLGGLRRGD